MSYDIESETLPERLTLVKRAHLAHEDLGDWLHRSYRDLVVHIAGCDVPVTGPPFARYGFGDGMDVEAGLPVAVPAPDCGELSMSSLPGHRGRGDLPRGPV